MCTIHHVQAAVRYYVGADGVAAWEELEQQTGGKWREGCGVKKLSQKRRQLWLQLKHLMALVEELAASKGCDRMEAAGREVCAGCKMG
jgi:hypothetical protein